MNTKQLDEEEKQELMILGGSAENKGIENIADKQIDPFNEYNDILNNFNYEFNKESGLVKISEGRNGIERRTISNFLAIPVKDIIKDDGEEKHSYFGVEGILKNGNKLNQVIVPYDKFGNMSWTINDKWSMKAVINPTSTNKEVIRYVTQLLSRNMKKETIYTHTGWRKLNGKWIYLHEGGAIGTNEKIKVDLSDIKVSGYGFSNKDMDVKEVLKTAYNFLNIADMKVTIPIISMVYLAPLVEMLRINRITPTFVMWITGDSGTRKSTISALALSHFGKFDSKSLPASFKDTISALEKKCFTFKDMLIVIDDFHPNNTLNESNKMKGLAESILRMYGDKVGKSRLSPSLVSRTTYEPRGLAIVTGEDFPSSGQSTNARSFGIEIKKEDVYLDKVTIMQRNLDCLSFTMKKYIEWLQINFDKLSGTIRSEFETTRDVIIQVLEHGRIAEAVAWLHQSFNYMLCFFKEHNVITDEELGEMFSKSSDILLKWAKKQSIKTKGERPSIKFLKAVSELLETGKIYTEDELNPEKSYEEIMKRNLGFSKEVEKPKGVMVGYRSNNRYCFFPDVIYAEVCKFFASQNISMPLSKIQLYKQLKEDGYTIAPGENRNVYRITVRGERREMLVLDDGRYKELIEGTEE